MAIAGDAGIPLLASVFTLSSASAKFFALFGVHLPTRYYPVPAPAGDYDHALHVDHPDAPSLLGRNILNHEEEEPRLGGKPKETATLRSMETEI